MNFAPEKRDTYWGTEDELAFLQGLGSHAGHNRFTPEELLDKYLMAAKKRVFWGGIDKKKLLIKINERIKNSSENQNYMV